MALTPDAIPAAFAYAADLRQTQEGAIELELEFRDANLVRDHARSRGIAQIAWIDAQGAINLE